MKIINVVGARPNFVKIAPIQRALTASGKFDVRLVHTGQHYDAAMSDVFFKDLGIPSPDVSLDVGSGSHAKQTAEIMTRFEEILIREKPDRVLVVGDVNSTLACSVAAAKLNVPVAHVEAGLRSYDRTMPEEINRMVTDTLSDRLFTTEPSGRANLLKEGKPDSQIFFTGNVMIDSLVYAKPALERSTVLSTLGLAKDEYAVVTLHRPNNVDQEADLKRMLGILKTVARSLRVVFPVHPRTRKNLERIGAMSDLTSAGVIITEPLGYIDFIRLIRSAKAVLTDSGGIQEETTFLGIPCLTLRTHTERPITVTEGTNTLLPTDSAVVEAAVRSILDGKYKKGRIPDLWDGQAAKRIVKVLTDA